MATQHPIRTGSGKVFADLKITDADAHLAKAKLAARISPIIKDRRLTQATAGRLLGIDQTKVSALTAGRLDGFSIDRRVRFLSMLS